MVQIKVSYLVRSCLHFPMRGGISSRTDIVYITFASLREGVCVHYVWKGRVECRSRQGGLLTQSGLAGRVIPGLELVHWMTTFTREQCQHRMSEFCSYSSMSVGRIEEEGGGQLVVHVNWYEHSRACTRVS